ncbi:phasin family protein [Leucothrix sargassi]|nr:phasin family protein [Leucothrix sargassi]
MTKSKAQPKTKSPAAPDVAETPSIAAVTEPVQDTIEMIQETVEAVKEDAVDAANETMAEAKSMFDTHLETSEKAMNNFIEFNESAYKSGQKVSAKMYEDYLSNVQAMFSGMKSLTATTTPTELYRVATENNASAIDRMKDQYSSMSELTEQAMQETMDASKKAFTGVFPTTA